MKKWLIFALLVCSARKAYGFLEDIEEYIQEVEKDPVRKHLLLFNDYAGHCFTEARKNQSTSKYDEDEAICCLQDFWKLCMKTMPLFNECMSLVENQFKLFEDTLLAGSECSMIDMRVCDHKDGHEEFVSGNKERTARFTSTASPNVASGLVAVIAVSLSLIGRVL